MKIDSQRVEVNAKASEIFEFLSYPKNIELLLPSDNIEDFKATDKGCSFKVQGGITITLEQDELIPHERINMKSGENSPFPFTLSVIMDAQDDKTHGYLAFDGEVNAFLKMMVQKPLTNLFNYMSGQLKERYE